jgi:hypothetical protein
MFDLFGIDAYLRRLDPIHVAAREARKAKRMAEAVPWSDDIKWMPELNIKADTYKPRSLFEVEPCNPAPKADEPRLVVSPEGRFAYAELAFPAGGVTKTFQGSRQGTALFDGPTLIPALYERAYGGGWGEYPWMSITPMELMTLRGGTRMAKGHVVVAGLGLGHQLIEVSKRKQVTKVTLVEKSQELVDWLLPRIEPFLGRPLDQVIVDDAYEEVPKLTADVALIDIFKGYGNNAERAKRLIRNATNIPACWVWGSATIA